MNPKVGLKAGVRADNAPAAPGDTAEAVRRSAKAGFTLIELLIVVLIIGLLAAIMVPRLDEARARAHFTSIVSDFRHLMQAQELYHQQNLSYADDLGDLVFSPSVGVEVEVTEASPQGWSALGTHTALEEDKGCSIYLGNASAPALPNGAAHSAGEGVPECAR